MHLKDKGMNQMKNTSAALVTMKNITKTFAGIKALDDVSVDFWPGKVHGLIGANGAGKSTLIKILAGAYVPDFGSIEIAGKPTLLHNPKAAGEHGLAFIHQELSLVENFNIVENITLGLDKVKKCGFIDWKATSKRLDTIMEQVGLMRPLNTPVKELSVGEKWLVAITRALFQDAKVIAMDEPTASLSATEVKMLFRVIREMAARGIGVIYVSHRLDEVLEICDELTLFTDGVKTLHTLTKNLTKEELINAIAGRKIEAAVSEDLDFSGTEVVLEIENIKAEGKVNGVGLQLHKGEVLGVTGLVGAGRTELVKVIFGANKCTEGNMMFEGKIYNPKSPADAVKKGIAMIPEERRSEGLITNKSVGFNINIPNLEKTRINSRIYILSRRKADKIAKEIIGSLFIKTKGADEQILSLSGGNQQKVVLGKWLKRNPSLIIMDEPTRGVDVGARTEIYKLIRSMAKDGISFIIVSSDMEELPGLCDRTLVMAGGIITGELRGSEITKDAMLRLSYAHS